MAIRVAAWAAVFGLALALAGPSEAQIRLGPQGGGGGGGGMGGGGSSGGGSGGGGASNGLIMAITPEVLAPIFSQNGYSNPQAQQMNNAAIKMITMQLGSVGTVYVTFFGCENSGCNSYQIDADFGKQQVNADFLNNYNRDGLWTKMYVDKQGNLNLSMEVFVVGGVSPNWVAASGVIFANQVNKLLNPR